MLLLCSFVEWKCIVVIHWGIIFGRYTLDWNYPNFTSDKSKDLKADRIWSYLASGEKEKNKMLIELLFGFWT